ncbi:MAG TPA: LON peptidase substrate-binding domain-containing protein [Deinococcales bacterium]|nr:LON peptidase substrate-binding domain-containing protein [Deinococcales bacterium]
MQVPLFPVGEVVLLPGMTLPIVVFEPRYRELLGWVRGTGSPFGIPCVLPPGAEAGGTTSIAPVGTLAHLTEVTYNPDHTASIWVAGGDRFRILSTSMERTPYLVAEARLEPLEPSDPSLVRAVAADVVERFLDHVKPRLGDIRAEVPAEPLLQSSFVAANLHLPGREAQAVLEAPTLLDRLELLAGHLHSSPANLN